MRKGVQLRSIALLAVVVLSVGTGQADEWRVVYQTDFTTDPAWTTNAAEHYHWDGAGRYHATEIDGSQEYATHAIDLSHNPSISLQFDVTISTLTNVGNVKFGLYNSDRVSYLGGGMPTPDTQMILFTFDHAFSGVGLVTVDSAGVLRFDHASPSSIIEANTPYRVLITYDADARTASADLTRLADGSLVRAFHVQGLSGFTDLEHVGFSKIGNAEPLNPAEYGEGFIDNVLLRALGAPCPRPDWKQWRAEDGGNDHWYSLTSSASPGSWDQAQAGATAAGGYLVAVNDEAEQTWLTANFPDESGYWIGLRQDPNDPACAPNCEPAGGWAWTSGEPLLFTNWAGGEPNNNHPTSEEVGIMTCYGQGLWCDFPNTASIPIRGIIERNFAPPIAGDIDGDGSVNQGDLGILLGFWGYCEGDPGFYSPPDLDCDGCVGQSDLGILLAHFGQ